MYTIYVVYEDTNYQDFANGERYDIGTYYKKIFHFETLKEVLKFGTGFAEGVIDDIVFFDEKEANKYILEQTLNKLQPIWIDLHFKDEEPFDE